MSRMEMEEMTGMTEYLDKDDPGFECVIKARFGDFVVNEIEDDLNVVRLDSDALPPLPTVTEAGPSETELTAIVGPTKLEEMRKLTESLFRSEIRLELAGRDKETRTLVHTGIRRLFPGKLETETSADGDILVRKTAKGTGRVCR